MWGQMFSVNDAHLLRSIVKNNLWVSVSGGQIWDFGSAVKDWRTDFNNDGFDWGPSATPFRYGRGALLEPVRSRGGIWT